MKQIERGNSTGLYFRLSKDDERAGESLSIENQRRILTEYARENGLTIYGEYADDGYSGTNFERPAVKRLLEDAKEGRINTILVKDLSRFGRNYIQVGQFVDYLFPCYGIRFIALSDNIDTADRQSAAMDMMPIMNVFNEWHAANTSKKIRSVFEASQRSGKYTNWNYPYGYRAGSDECRTAVVDEAAANVVRRIYDLRIQGLSVRAICKILSDEGVPNPATYYRKRDGTKSNRICSSLWNPRTVMWILTNPTYLGRTTQHKTTSVSYKNHKVVRIPESEWIVREHAHEPIIDQKIWDQAQAVNQSVSRGKSDRQSKTHSLSGLLICPDCGKKLKLQRSGRGDVGFLCRTYKDFGKKYCTSHYISETVLEKIILQDLRSMMNSLKFDEKKAEEKFLRTREKTRSRSRALEEKRWKTCQNRLAELNLLLCSAFEEKILKGISEESFLQLSETYEAEKAAVKKEIADLEQRRKCDFSDHESAADYVEALKRFYRCECLTRELCLQLIESVAVGEKNGDGEREISIRYQFINPGLPNLSQKEPEQREPPDRPVRPVRPENPVPPEPPDRPVK